MINAYEEINNFIKAVKETKFCTDFVDELYICSLTPETIWFKAKAPYDKVNEVTLWNDTQQFSHVLRDITFADGDVISNTKKVE